MYKYRCTNLVRSAQIPNTKQFVFQRREGREEEREEKEEKEVKEERGFPNFPPPRHG